MTFSSSTLFFTATLILAASGSAFSAEIKLVSPGAVASSLNELVPKFEQSFGHKVTISYSPALALAERIKNGESADVAIVGDSAADELQKLGKLTYGSKVVIAKVGIGVFVRRGDPKPEIGTVDLFKDALANAKIITYSDPALGGTAANYLASLMTSIDVDGSIRKKTQLTPPAKPLADFVANGGADFGLNQITEILADPRLELVGPLPEVIQSYTVYAANVMVSSENKDAGQALIDFLTSSDAGAIMRRKGFERR